MQCSTTENKTAQTDSREGVVLPAFVESEPGLGLVLVVVPRRHFGPLQVASDGRVHVKTLQQQRQLAWDRWLDTVPSLLVVLVLGFAIVVVIAVESGIAAVDDGAAAAPVVLQQLLQLVVVDGAAAVPVAPRRFLLEWKRYNHHCCYWSRHCCSACCWVLCDVFCQNIQIDRLLTFSKKVFLFY